MAQQLDLFAGPPPVLAQWQTVGPAVLNDAAMIAMLPGASQMDAPALAEACVQRRLTPAVPALEELCRRFKGFGLHSVVPEQRAALLGLRGLGAGTAIVRLIETGAVQGPGLAIAVKAAATVGARLPEPLALAFLRHPDPGVRSDACRCARPSAAVTAILLELLTDLHPSVADAAACALGRSGRHEAHGRLLKSVVQVPTVELILAVAVVADDDDVVLLGRLAVSHPSFRGPILSALDGMETERAAVVAAGVRRRMEGDHAP